MKNKFSRWGFVAFAVKNSDFALQNHPQIPEIRKPFAGGALHRGESYGN